MTGYHAESCIVRCPEDIKQEWNDLQKFTDCSYFQSWGWIRVWLEQIAIERQPIVVKVKLNGELVGLGLFVSRDIKRRKFFYSRAMFLNEYPFDGRNMVVEYNGMLSAKDHESSVYLVTAQYLLREYKGYDEFVFGAVIQGSIPFSSKSLCVEGQWIINDESASWSVDLTGVPKGIDGYLSSLSRNRRGQIRRSIRVYEQGGLLQIEEALNTEQALHYFDRLKALHSEYWQSKGESGSFANPVWYKFHQALIGQRLVSGEIQLLKVSSNDGEIGYIYNVVWDKHVYVIQTGFRRSDDKRLMPGYVAHTVAIAYNQSKGMAIYDLMHGEALYKRILCNRKQKLLWVVLQRKQLKFLVENFAVRVVRYMRELSSRRS